MSTAKKPAEPEPEVVTVDRAGYPPLNAEGEFDTKNAEAAKAAAEKAQFPDEGAKEFTFGDINFKIKQFTLKRERTFLRLFPVLQEPFERWTALMREGEEASSKVRIEHAAELQELQDQTALFDATFTDNPADIARRTAIEARLAEINRQIAAARGGQWSFLIEVVANSGDGLIDALVTICAASLDNAKPPSMKEPIDSAWVEGNLLLQDVIEVLGAQIREQSWGNFLQRAAESMGAMTTGT